MSVGMMNPQIHSPSELPPPDKNRISIQKNIFNYYLIGTNYVRAPTALQLDKLNHNSAALRIKGRL